MGDEHRAFRHSGIKEFERLCRALIDIHVKVNEREMGILEGARRGWKDAFVNEYFRIALKVAPDSRFGRLKLTFREQWIF